MYDVVIIGAGIIGTSVARDLSAYNLKLLLIDKEPDVSNGATKANSGIIHAGYDAIPGTLKARLNVEGNLMFDKLCEELNVRFKRVGSLVVAFSDEEMKKVHKLYERGLENGVPSMEIIGKAKLKEIEPHINNGAVGALWAKTAGIVSSYELAVALAENAVVNGAEVMLDTEVKDIEEGNGVFNIITSKGKVRARYVINASGLFADDINNMLGGEKFTITPRKGEYCLFDKSQGYLAKQVIFRVPTKMGKGILVTPTVHGNLLIGPNAANTEDKTDLSTTRAGIKEVIDGAVKLVDKLPVSRIITSFAGLRATTEKGDFIINSPADRAVNAAGIDSPGLTSAPAISRMVIGLLKDMGLPLKKNESYSPVRNIRKRFADMTKKERKEAIRANSLYGRVICRCETVTEGEIVDAIRRPVGPRTVDGVKKRLRAGAGRCQGGFCMPRVIEILSRELNIPYSEIVKDTRNSFLFTGTIKDNMRAEDGDSDE
jgi:glycerol-3-phosphate dehydrogenase